MFAQRKNSINSDQKCVPRKETETSLLLMRHCGFKGCSLRLWKKYKSPLMKIQDTSVSEETVCGPKDCGDEKKMSTKVKNCQEASVKMSCQIPETLE